MPWVTENFIGTKNGINTVFTISHAPMLVTMFAVHSGRTLFQVANLPHPGQFQYGVSGTTVTVGDPPDDENDAFWTRYFYEA